MSFLGKLEADPEADFEALCARHPELAYDLRWLDERHAQADAWLRALQDDEEEPELPDVGDRYEVLGEIAHGGMGRVLEVKDGELDRVLAMKILRERRGATRRGLERQRARMVNEARVLGKLEHPGIVPIHEVGSDAHGLPYFTMLRVRGKALSEIFDDVKAGRDGWTTTRAVGVLLRVCEAVAHAHSKGIVHRDLKPSNVMVGPFGEVFVMDWGLARVRGGAAGADIRPRATGHARDGDDGAQDASPGELLTMDGDVLGTPSYMSPEQARGSVEDVDERSDVYSAGAMLYHLLAGRAPYVDEESSSTPREILRAVLRGEPEPLERAAPDATRELASVCAKAMARERRRRYGSMRELADDLRAFLENRVVQAHATGALVELAKWMQRHRGVVALGALLLTVLVGATIALGVLYRLADRRLVFLEQNPSGYRIEYADFPSAASFVEDFDDGELDPAMRYLSSPQDIAIRDGKLVLDRRGPTARFTSIALNDSLAVVKGDFELSVSFELEGFSMPTVGNRSAGICVRRVRDGLLVANVSRFDRANDGRSGDAGYLGTNQDHHSLLAWDRPAGQLRISREGTHVTASAWFGEWRPVLEVEGTDEPVMFMVYVGTSEGDEGEFRALFDDLRLEGRSGDAGGAIAPLVETFDGDLGPYLRPEGNAGVAAAVDGRLELETLGNGLGISTAVLDTQRVILENDFDVSLAYELVDFPDPAEGSLLFRLWTRGDSGNQASLIIDARTPHIIEAATLDGLEATSPRRTPTAAGKLRIERVGTRLRLSCWGDVDGDWLELLSTTESSQRVGFGIALETAVTPVGAVVAIDDLYIEGLVRR